MQLVSHGTIDMLLKVTKIETSDQSSFEEILILTHSILAKIGPKGVYTVSYCDSL